VARVTRSGQISLPAEIRHRWNADSVMVLDRGEYVVVRPMPNDPVAALRGIFAGAEPTTNEMRRLARQEEIEAEERRSSQQ
jgi:bifunctional DNA-binding transcriptional regulator/antitoxin component of YhaV-PrlF toxin-antitoxin module